MAKIHNQPQISSFDDALLDIVINDSKHNVELQNLVNMTAQTLFEKPTAMTFSATAEQAFLNSYNEAWILALLKNRLFLFMSGILLLSLFIIPQMNSPKNNPSTNQMAASTMFVTSQGETSGDSLIEEDKYQTLIPPSVHKVRAKTLKEITYQPVNTLNFTKPQIIDEDTLYELLDDSRAKKVNQLNDYLKFHPGGYEINLMRYSLRINQYEKLKMPNLVYDGLIVDSNNNDVSFSKQRNVMNLPMYLGIPFSKGFDHLAYISAYDAKNVKALNVNKQGPDKRAALFNAPDALTNYMDYNSDSPEEEVYRFFGENMNIDKLQPFYMSKKEVSNLEYKEFIHFVKRYNGYEDKNPHHDKSSVDFQKAFTYTFHTLNKEVVEAFGKNSVHIYPDTAVWVTDFPGSYNKPMSDYYLSHPAYANYPIVGVNYYQALAYCDWLTWIWKTRFDLANIPYDVEIDLPTSYEWELAVEDLLRVSENVSNSNQSLSSFYNNLVFDQYQDNKLRRSLGLYSWYGMENDADGNFHTGLVSNNVDYLGISNYLYRLEGNVSEWLKDDYSTSYKDYRLAYRKQLKTDTLQNPLSMNLMLQLDDYFWNTCNTEKGKMVAGANWFDARLSKKSMNLNDAFWSKAFIDPSEVHSTIGFRYVMRVKLKDEAKIRKKVQTFGHALSLMDYTMVDDEYYSKGNYMVNPNGFEFIPMGTDNRSISYQAFYAKKTEVTNFEWMLFLNDLIEYGKDEDLEACIPKDSMWAYKMRYEVTKNHSWKESLIDWDNFCFPKSFVKENKLEEIPLTYFATKPVVGISREAAMLFIKWITDVYTGEFDHCCDFRLPTENEYEWMAYGGDHFTHPYPWGGPYTRNSQGAFLANFKWESVSHGSDSLGNKKPENYVGLWPAAYFPPNEFGLYDLSGNASEMVREKDIVKGGSWNSPARYITILSKQPYDGKPSDEVGFRIVVTYLGKKKEE